MRVVPALNVSVALAAALHFCVGCADPPAPVGPETADGTPPLAATQPSSGAPEAGPSPTASATVSNVDAGPPKLTNLNLTQPDRPGFTADASEPNAPLLRITTMKTRGALVAGTIAEALVDGLAGM